MDPLIPLKGVKHLLGDAARRFDLARRDALANLRRAKAPRRFLVVRHIHKPEVYEVLLRWAEREFPELRALFELRQLPCRIRGGSPYILHAPWLLDPVQQWSRRAYDQAMRLAEDCRARGIPMINPVDRLPNAGKASGARIFREAGARTPCIERIGDVAEFRATRLGLSFPLLVREDWGHNLPIYRVEDEAALLRVPYEALARPIAAEFIDVRDPRDGLYRKYRYLAAGDVGIALSVHISKAWMTYGGGCEDSPALIEEERAYLDNPLPVHLHEIFQKARRALELDFLAIDFGYDPEGRLVVWEANPFPRIRFPRPDGKRQYRARGVDRALAAMLALYLERAGLEVPDSLRDRVEGRSFRPVGTAGG